jgi:hypothetical protein
MISLNSSVPEAIRRFKANPWLYERTLVTPRMNIAVFLSALLEVFPIEQGEVATDEVVFEPDNVLKFLADRELRLDDYWSLSALATGVEDVQTLLAAMLSDWIDFAFVPSPPIFAMYADHDEYLTIYVPSESGLRDFVHHLEAKGFRFVDDYVRPTGYLAREHDSGPPTANQ